MTTQLCKNRYFADLIKRRKVCTGMTPDMVTSAWNHPSIRYMDGDKLVWQWGSQRKPHSKVVFEDRVAIEVYTDFLKSGRPGTFKR